MIADVNWIAMEKISKKLSKGWKTGDPGGVILGFDRSGVRFSSSGGIENFSGCTPFGSDTTVRFASVTKHVFCAMVLMSPELIGLDDNLGQHLPELHSAAAAVTVVQALSMTSGLPDTRECLALHGLTMTSLSSAPELFRYLASMERLNFPAGSEISYSNSGYRLVEIAMQRRGISFDGFVQEFIRGDLCQPMIAPELWGDAVCGLAPGYWKSETGWHLGMQGMHISAAGSLCGSANSLSVWLRALMADQGRLSGVFARLIRCQPLEDGRLTDYGLGMRWFTIKGRRFVGHTGSQPGYKSLFLLDLPTQSGIVILSNREDTACEALAEEILSAGFGLHETDPAIDARFVPGYYTPEAGPRWIEAKKSSVVFLDDEVAISADWDGRIFSRSATCPVELKRQGEALVGSIGFAPIRLMPADPSVGPPIEVLEGSWEAREFGAGFDIENGNIVLGIGPQREALHLTPLGGGRWLFTQNDGPWARRICLYLVALDRIELVTSRARMIEYSRVDGQRGRAVEVDRLASATAADSCHRSKRGAITSGPFRLNP
jgi:CubicO group peptidase (beta-lactamase class C family)